MCGLAEHALWNCRNAKFFCEYFQQDVEEIMDQVETFLGVVGKEKIS